MVLGNGNGNGSKIEAITESVWTRSISRLAMMSTPVLLVIGGWIFNDYLATQRKAWEDQASLNKELVKELGGLNDRVLVIETQRAEERRYERRSRQPLHVPPSALPPPDD